MLNRVAYEWTIEEVDEHGDIQDCSFFERLDECGDVSIFKTNDVGLMRRIGNNDDGEKDREYVYVEDGKLPDCFDNGAKVPKRFHEELARFISAEKEKTK